jgi:hypothetical protein
VALLLDLSLKRTCMHEPRPQGPVGIVMVWLDERLIVSLSIHSADTSQLPGSNRTSRHLTGPMDMLVRIRIASCKRSLLLLDMEWNRSIEGRRLTKKNKKGEKN